MRNPLNALKRGVHFLPCYLEIKKMREDLPISYLVDKTLNSWGKILSPLQVRSEIIGLLEILKLREPRVILEIGTAKGGTLFLFSRIASKDAKIISLDLPKGEFGGGYSIFKIPLYKSFVRGRQKISLVRKDSHKLKTLNQIRDILSGEKVDLLFIDGDHTYEGVKKDFEMYGPLVKNKGLIVFHDISDIPPPTGVRRLWKEIKGNKKEIIEKMDLGWGGIGILEKKD